MIIYIYYILATVGISYFITQSDLMEPFRKWVNLIYRFRRLKKKHTFLIDKFLGVITCIYCCSFWIGISLYFGVELKHHIVHVILSAFSVLGAIYLIRNLGK